MEFGLIPNLEQFQFNSQKQIQVVNATKESRELHDDQSPIEELATHDQAVLGDVKEPQKAELKPTKLQEMNEFVLTNVNFGYNSSSKDFFVKVVRGEFESQYPTEEMMKLKANLLNADQTEAS